MNFIKRHVAWTFLKTNMQHCDSPIYTPSDRRQNGSCYFLYKKVITSRFEKIVLGRLYYIQICIKCHPQPRISMQMRIPHKNKNEGGSLISPPYTVGLREWLCILICYRKCKYLSNKQRHQWLDRKSVVV